MKISIILAILGIVTFLVFWGDKSGTTIPPEISSSEFKIRIKGENIEEEKTFQANYFDYQLSAFANHPLSQINWGDNNGDISGYMRVNPNSKDAHIDSFETNHTVSHSKDGWKIQADLSASTSTSQTSYKITDTGHQHKNIQLQIKQPNILYSTSQSPHAKYAELTGIVAITTPADWAIFQPQRFPVLPIQGQLTFNGENYHLVNIDFGLSNPKASNGMNYEFRFEHQDKILVIHYNQANINAPRNLIFLHDDGNYQLELKADDPRWQESTQDIKINLSPITMKMINHDASSKISAQLTIPKNHAQLKANNQPLILLLGNSTQFASTDNNEKTYELVFAFGEENLTLSINQIGQGPFYLHSYDKNGDDIYCGIENIQCKGLSASSDKKTFTFNQVKFGQYTLNGTVFIAGVL